MAIWLQILLTLLPKILEWLQSLLTRNGRLTEAQIRQINHVLYQFHQIEDVAVRAGANPGGARQAGRPKKAAGPDIWTLPLVLLGLLLVGTARADVPQAPRPPQAPPMGCTCDPCMCLPGKCDCPNCRCSACGTSKKVPQAPSMCDCNPCTCAPGKCVCGANCACASGDCRAPKIQQGPSYTDVMALCARDGTDAIVFVGLPRRKVPGLLSCQKDTLDGIDVPCVLLVVRQNGKACLLRTFDTDPGDEALFKAVDDYHKARTSRAQASATQAYRPVMFSGMAGVACRS